jgi:uncharacterized membrane protein
MARTEFPGTEEERFNQSTTEPLWQRQLRPAESYGRQMSTSGSWPELNGQSEVVQAQRLARTLGWFSIGLGMTELAAPATVARITGINGSRGLIQALGLREIAHGLGILSGPKPVGWLWSRVFGDVIDLAVLARAAGSPEANKLRVVASAAAITGMTVLDFLSSQQLERVADRIEDDGAIQIKKSILINRPVEEIYRFWRDFDNLPRVMEHLESVEVTDDKRSRWTAKGPGGKRIRWEAEITEDRPNELIAWRSIEGAAVENSGSVRFEAAPGERGTVVRVELDYQPPAGSVGATIARIMGREPQLQIQEDLRRLKQIMEAGEVVTTKGQPAGRSRSTSWKYDYAGRRLASAF